MLIYLMEHVYTPPARDCVLVAITISPPYRTKVETTGYSQYKYNYKWLFEDDYLTINKAMYPATAKYILYPEITLEGRLHYHGWAWISDMIRWKRTTMPVLNRIGLVKIKSSNLTAGWTEYCTKEWSETQAILEITHPMSRRKAIKPLQARYVPPPTKTILDYLM